MFHLFCSFEPCFLNYLKCSTLSVLGAMPNIFSSFTSTRTLCCYLQLTRYKLFRLFTLLRDLLFNCKKTTYVPRNVLF